MESDQYQTCQYPVQQKIENVLMDIKIEPNIKLANGHISIQDSPKRWSSQNGNVGSQDNRKRSPWKSLFYSEYGRTIVALVYTRVVMLATEFTVAYIQFHIPNRKKHPPLPDIILDNIKIVPWGSKLCEVLITINVIIALTIVFFHKHRLVVIRRYCCLMAVMYMTRILTITMTGLPVPSTEKICETRKNGSFPKYVAMWLEIIKHNGFQISGLKTCGDYMFSGHTVALTLLVCFIRQYSHRRYRVFNLMVLASNFVGMYYILASHGHYSIDVFIAFLMTYRTFHYYHSLVNNRTNSSKENNHIFLLPLFSYFEMSDPGRVVTNEYEWLVTPVGVKNFFRNSIGRLKNLGSRIIRCFSLG